jgi:hypothetical protein
MTSNKIGFLSVVFLLLHSCRVPAAIDLDSGDWLEWSSAPATAAPLTMYCRFSADTASNVAFYVNIREGTNLNDGAFTIGHNASAQFRAMAVESSVFAAATLTSPTVSTSTWHHGFGVFESTTSRWAYLNADGVQNTTSLTPAGLDNLTVGRSNNLQLVGQIAEVCIWNVALSSDQRAAIASGARPCAVEPSAVVFYCSGANSTTAEVGGAPTVIGSPTIVAHPSVIYVTRAMAHARRR